jgi:hypothetical protein
MPPPPGRHPVAIPRTNQSLLPPWPNTDACPSGGVRKMRRSPPIHDMGAAGETLARGHSGGPAPISLAVTLPAARPATSARNAARISAGRAARSASAAPSAAPPAAPPAAPSAAPSAAPPGSPPAGPPAAPSREFRCVESFKPGKTHGFGAAGSFKPGKTHGSATQPQPQPQPQPRPRPRPRPGVSPARPRRCGAAPRRHHRSSTA